MNSGVLARSSLTHRLLLLALLVLCTYWIFIDIYRVNAFNIVPHDDYAPYLLHILGEEGGKMPGSPFAYRLFSVAAAAPFYFVLPVYKFTLLENVDVTYLRAVEALAMLAYVSMLAASVLVYMIITKRLGGSAPSGLIGSLGMLLVLQFSGYKGIDPVGILLVCMLIYYSRNPVIFGALIFLSIGVNEKIALILSLLMGSRLVFGRDKAALPYAILSGSAFAMYLAIRVFSDIPGNEHQMEINNFLMNAWGSIRALFSLKRIILELMPMLTLSLLYVLALKEYWNNTGKYRRYFSVTDISALLGLILVTLAVGMKFNTGRIVIFCAPFYLPLAAIYIERAIQEMGTEAPQGL